MSFYVLKLFAECSKKKKKVNIAMLEEEMQREEFEKEKVFRFYLVQHIK